ncbi:SCO1860 family LAETG-anchored protein [Streptomyces sp. t39]|uniref:SCO1860 family LAETG-anchored protein n=1 Tax=Streptomyces sp. t39 TaxID=1828156 RepID=UPI0011CE9847|nr:SCO1860 family LAETG-anchored protein [Streptomyces sp. t39]TXS51101.1 LPXTG cell wall anchor domain-containing protein [Streptomyces sp. t39]
MNSNTFRTSARVPARRLAAATAAAALIAGPLALAAPAHATGGKGRAGAVVLRTGLDVALLDKTVHVPLKATLNEVQAPAGAEKTALSVTLDGVDKGRPVQVLRADVATAKASVEGRRAEASSKLVKARVHVPGLPLLSVIEVEQVTSKAVCEAGEQPVATSNLLGHVKVLGKKVTLGAAGPTVVEVPAVGTVSLELSTTRTTSTTAAAAALKLDVSVDPLNLNVAEVTGGITLAEATCTSPAGAVAPEEPAEPQEPEEAAPPAEEPEQPGRDIAAQSAEEPEANLAATGGSSATPYIAGGAGLLLTAGAAAIVVTRRRSRAEG